MATNFGLSGYNTPDTAIAGSAFNALATGGFAWGAEIDNSVGLFPYGTLSLALSAAVTSVAPAYLTFYLSEPDAAGNYAMSSGDPGASQAVATWYGPGGSFRYTGGVLIGRLLAPKFKIVMKSNLGVSLVADNAAVCQLQRFRDVGT